MDIGGVNRIKTAILTPRPEVKKSSQSATERDTQGNGYQKAPQKITRLTPEQEEETLKKLNSTPSFTNAGLRAELVRADDTIPHIIVRSANNEIVRHLPYAQIVEWYVDRNSDNSTGRLLKSSA